MLASKTTGRILAVLQRVQLKDLNLKIASFLQQLKKQLLASFRPCKRCRPGLSHPNQVSALVQTLVEAVEI